MKYWIVIILIGSFSLNAEEYIVPKDVIAARDSAVQSMNKFRDRIVSRYFKLSQKKNLSVQEKDELFALEIVIFEKDSSEYLIKRLKKHKKKK